ncbi:hypothetical protein GCM10009771_07740 [Nesterenkonia flava]
MTTTHLWRSLERQLPEGFTPRYQWLWILPAGAVPALDALERLEDRLFTVKDEATHGAIEIVGAKQLHSVEGADDVDARLVNVGLYPGPTGEVLSLTEPKELDQGQYDGRDAVPAVSAHGMLVHAPLFGDLGGFDPSLSGDYAAAQFCRRAREVGAEIVIAPESCIFREDPPRREAIHRFGGALYLPTEQRIGQIRSRLGQARPLAVPVLWLGEWFLALLRLLALTAIKAPDAGAAQFAAAVRALLNLAALGAARKHEKIGRGAALARLLRSKRIKDERATLSAGRAAHRDLILTRERIRQQRQKDLTAETVGLERLSPGAEASRDRDEEALLTVGSSDGEFDQMPARRSEDRLGLFLMLVGLGGVSLLGFRDLLTAPALGGGAALPVSPSLAELFTNSISFIAPDTLGERAAADPFNLVLMLLSVFSVTHVSALLLWITILSLPLSAATAWWAAGSWTSKGWHRVLAGLLWALLPAFHTSIGQGRLGPVLAHILLPVAVVAVTRALAARRRTRVEADPESPRRVASIRLAAGWEHAAAAALLLVLITASAPVLLPVVVLLCLVGSVVMGRPGRILWLLPLPSLALFAPMMASSLDNSGNMIATLLAEPGVVVSTAQAGAPAPVWQQLLGFSVAFDPAAGLPAADGSAASWLPSLFADDLWAVRAALLVGGPLVLLALLGILATRGRRTPAVAGLVAVVVLVISAVVTEFAVGAAAGQLVPAYNGPLVSAAALALIAAALSGIDSIGRTWQKLGGLVSSVAVTLLVLSLAASAVFWAVPRLTPSADLSDQPLTAVNPQQTLIERGSVRGLPATAADQGTGPAQLRTLVLSAGDHGVTAELASARGRTLDKDRTAIDTVDLPRWASHAGLSQTLGLSGDPDARTLDDLSLSEQRLADLTAALLTPGAEGIPEMMAELGIGYVLLEEPASASLAEAMDTAGGMVSVGSTDRGLLWRTATPDTLPAAAPELAGAATAWARIVDAERNIVALLPSEDRRISTDLSRITDSNGDPLDVEPDQDYFLELASERAGGWHAELDGTPLRAATETSTGHQQMPWTRMFHLSGEHGVLDAQDGLRGELTVEHRSTYQYPILFGVAAFLLLVALIAVPLPRSWRILPVASTAELEGRPL